MDKTNDTNNVSKSRRNLIKASAAAPVIASLHPGAAIAQTSVSPCVKKSHYDNWVMAADGAMRYESKLYVRKAGHGPNRLIEVEETASFGNTKLIDLDTGVEYGLNTLSKKIYKEPAIWNTIPVAKLDDDYEDADPIYLLIGYDAHNNYNKYKHWPLVEIDGHDTVALSQSCHTSIHPHGGL